MRDYHEFIQEVMIDEDTLQKRVSELGAEISRDYQGDTLLLICILRGGVMFLTDLMRHIEVPHAIEFMAVSSYGVGKRQSSGQARITLDINTNISGRHVLLVEDIIDSGHTLKAVLDLLSTRGPKSLNVCALLDKAERREVDVNIKYSGFTIPNRFVFGYGLDIDEYYRNLPFIGVVDLNKFSTGEENVTIHMALPYPEIFAALRALKRPGQEIYLVGGAVRDLLLGKAIHDLDFSLSGPVKPLGRQLADRLEGAFYVLDDERDIVRVIYTPKDNERMVLDLSAMRAQGLEGDLRSRDFTVNAIALSIDHPDQVLDPMGGAADLRAGILRACSESTFIDDPARVLRAVRQSLEHKLHMTPDTYRELRAAAGELKRISPERQRDEIFRLLDSGSAASGIRLLDQAGALRIVLPELERLKGVQQSSPHVLDVWEHTLSTIQELDRLFALLVAPFDEDASANLTHGLAVLKLGRFRQHFREHYDQRLNQERSMRSLLLFAGLYHDVGKPARFLRGEGGQIHFLEHEDDSAVIAADRARGLALSQVEVERIRQIVKNHMRVHWLASAAALPGPRAVHRFFRACDRAGVDICLFSLADMLATYQAALPQASWRRELDVCLVLLETWWEKHNGVVAPPRLVNGNDLIERFGLAKGPIVGKLLEAIVEAQAAGEINGREEALAFAAEWLKNDQEEI